MRSDVIPSAAAADGRADLDDVTATCLRQLDELTRALDAQDRQLEAARGLALEMGEVTLQVPDEWLAEIDTATAPRAVGRSFDALMMVKC